jgi:hypothetical protein
MLQSTKWDAIVTSKDTTFVHTVKKMIEILPVNATVNTWADISAMCSKCPETEETSAHLWSCPVHFQARLRIRAQIQAVAGRYIGPAGVDENELTSMLTSGFISERIREALRNEKAEVRTSVYAAIGNAINHSARLNIWKISCETNIKRFGQKRAVFKEKSEINYNWEVVKDFQMRGRYNVSHLRA